MYNVRKSHYIKKKSHVEECKSPTPDMLLDNTTCLCFSLLYDVINSCEIPVFSYLPAFILIQVMVSQGMITFIKVDELFCIRLILLNLFLVLLLTTDTSFLHNTTIYF